MAKKNRNKNKKKKESDGSTGSVKGGSSRTVATTTTTIASTTEAIEMIDIMHGPITIALTPKGIEMFDIEHGLKGYPKSNDFVIGYRQFKTNQDDLAIASSIRGIENDSCLPCMFLYVQIQMLRGNLHLVVPFRLECAIRGHLPSMNNLFNLYNKSKPVMAMALRNLWLKMGSELGYIKCTEEERKEIKKDIANICTVCGKEESEDNDVTLVKCGICKFYSYCGKTCQTSHWQEGKHMNECRQVMILRKYCKPSYVKEIREAIIGGEDPKEIRTLQRLRMKLGLNRPKEEYEELLLSLANDDANNNNNNNNNTMKCGTKVKVEGLVKASQHNGKFGIVTKDSIPGEAGGSSRVGVKLLDDSGTVLSIKIENLKSPPTTTITNRPNPFEYLIARKDGTVHIGSTPNTI